jgi:hypothetical protein
MSTPFEYIDASEDTGTDYPVVRGRMSVVDQEGKRLPYMITSVVINPDVWCITDLHNGYTAVLKGEGEVKRFLRHLKAKDLGAGFSRFVDAIAEAAIEMECGEKKT